MNFLQEMSGDWGEYLYAMEYNIGMLCLYNSMFLCSSYIVVIILPLLHIYLPVHDWLTLQGDPLCAGIIATFHFDLIDLVPSVVY